MLVTNVLLTDNSLETQFGFDDRNRSLHIGFVFQYNLGITDFQLAYETKRACVSDNSNLVTMDLIFLNDKKTTIHIF